MSHVISCMCHVISCMSHVISRIVSGGVCLLFSLHNQRDVLHGDDGELAQFDTRRDERVLLLLLPPLPSGGVGARGTLQGGRG